MCQLNVYLVPEEVPEAKVLQALEEAGFNEPEKVSLEQFEGQIPSGFVTYGANGWCNCDSVISHEQFSEYKTLKDLQTKFVAKEVERLECARDYMLRPEYPEELAVYQEKRDALWAEHGDLMAKVQETEKQMTSAVMNRTDISEEEKNSLMHSDVYPRFNEIMRENESTPEYLDWQRRWKEFCDSNRQMSETAGYILVAITETVEEHRKRVRDMFMEVYESVAYERYETFEDYFQSLELVEEFDDSVDKVLTIQPSIYDHIEEAKRRDFNELTTEFDSVKKFALSMLRLVDEIKLFTYWRDDNEKVLSDWGMVDMKDFSIDSVLPLPHERILTVKR
jgi:hypothetical protein